MKKKVRGKIPQTLKFTHTASVWVLHTNSFKMAKKIKKRDHLKFNLSQPSSESWIEFCRRVLRKFFYRALIQAKGYKLGNNGPGRPGNRASRGRQAEFKTKVHGNGNLLIGHAYTKKLGLQPGQGFKIDLKKESKTIYLTPLK